MMRIVISLALCGMIPSRSAVVLGKMVGRVNEGMCVCWAGCWGGGGVSETDIRGGGDDLTDISLFVSGLPTNSQNSLAEGRDVKKYCPILNMKHRSSKILTLSHLIALPFFSINLSPRDIQNLFQKSEICDIDTFKFIIFASGSNM